MDYHQLTSDERNTISALKTQGLRPSEIAENLGRHRSTVYRELKRNACNEGRYRVSKAISRTTGRRSRSRRNRQFSHEDFKVLKRYIRKKWSPKQVPSPLANKRSSPSAMKQSTHISGQIRPLAEIFTAT